MDNILSRVFGMGTKVKVKDLKVKTPPTPPEISAASPNVIIAPPRGQSAVRDTRNSFFDSQKGVRFVSQSELVRLVPLLRKLALVDRNVGQVVHDMVLLTNTGYSINFDPGVSADQRDKMRMEINRASKNWVEGGYGLHSIINKLTSQLLLGGALSAEWVPSKSLRDGIDFVLMVNPEDILFGLNKESGRYEPYQTVYNINAYDPKDSMGDPIKKLNQQTYKYFGFLGDTDIPYGIPMFLSALKDLGIQEDMLKNISFIMKQLGIMGFTQLLMEKPNQDKNENDGSYKSRLERLLTEAKNNILEGASDGVVVGFAEDHKYEFQSTTRDMAGLPEIFALNQQMVASGLKFSPQFLSSGTGTDTAISIIFTKLLSQLINIQTAVAAMLEFGMSFHLRLKGFQFETLTVKFNPSTVTDDLKMQQAREIKQRTSRLLYDDGIISQDQYADEMGYQKPDMEEPRITHDPIAIAEEARKATERETKKDQSDRTGRDKKNPQPKRKDGDSKKR